MGMDIKSLIPSFLLTSPEVNDFLGALQELLDESKRKIDSLKDAIDPREIEREFLYKLITLIGGHDLPYLSEDKYRKFIRVADQMWWSRSSKNFYKMAEYFVSTSLPFTDLDDYTLKLSDGLPIGSAYIENNYYRQGSLKLEVSITDYEAVKALLYFYGIAGFYVYIVLSGLQFYGEAKSYGNYFHNFAKTKLVSIAKVFSLAKNIHTNQVSGTIKSFNDFVTYFNQLNITNILVFSFNKEKVIDQNVVSVLEFFEFNNILNNKIRSNALLEGDIIQRSPYIMINEEAFILK